MASVYHLLGDAIHTEEDIVAKYSDHEYESQVLYFAALKIQKVFRGFLARQMVAKWNRAATKIQKTVRGWLVRYHLPDVLQEYHDYQCITYYSRKATKIQSLWRGFSIRQKICIEYIRYERAEVLAVSEKIQTAIRKSAQTQQRPEVDPTIVRKVLKMLFDRHHLLRTYQKEGIFSYQDSKELTHLEAIMKCMQWKDYMDEVREYYNKYSKIKTEYKYMFEDKHLRKMEDLYRQRDRSREVKVEKYRTKEARPFVTRIDSKPYERWLLTTEEYTFPIKHIVRTEEKSKNICDNEFDLHVLKMVAKEADVPAYYINFWYEQCKIHNIP